MPVPLKICHPSIAVLLYCLLPNSWWFDGFLAASRVSSLDNDTDDLVGVGQKQTNKKRLYVSLCHIDAVRLRMKVEQEKIT